MSYLEQALIYIGAAVIAVPLAKRLGFGSVLGYLAAGIVIGPAVLGLIDDVDYILHFAELGVVFLLFIIGLELKPARLWVLRKQVFGLGTAQLVGSAIVLGSIALLYGMSVDAAIVIGFGLGLSSTAFVLQLLAEQNKLASAYGRSAFSILLLQDLAVIPLLALIPLLAGGDEARIEPLQIAITVGAIVVLIFGGRYALRPVLRWVAQTKIHELFTAVALFVVLGAAVFLEAAGLSMGLGAFLAGMLLADSEYRHELEADIEPFKGLLLGLFFIAVGMSVNLQLIVSRPVEVFGFTVVLVLAKAAVLYLVAKAFSLEDGVPRGLAAVLAQGGEFAFVLFTLARQEGVLDAATIELLIVVVTLSMAVTPFLYLANEAVERRGKSGTDDKDFDEMPDENKPVVIASFGRFGQIVGRMLRSRGIEFTALESNPEQVEVVRKYGSKVYYGDASRMDLLRTAGMDRASFFILAIDDIEQSVKTAKVVRQHWPKLPILARAHNRFHAHLLMDLGVTEIYRDTFYSSLEMGRSLFRQMGLAGDEADHIVDTFARHDEATLKRQYDIHQDETKLIQTAQEAAAELETLLRADSGRKPKD